MSVAWLLMVFSVSQHRHDVLLRRGGLPCRDPASANLGVAGNQKLTRRLKRQYNEINHVTPVRK